jgi:hypothetical protein
LPADEDDDAILADLLAAAAVMSSTLELPVPEHPSLDRNAARRGGSSGRGRGGCRAAAGQAGRACVPSIIYLLAALRLGLLDDHGRIPVLTDFCVKFQATKITPDPYPAIASV